jgi:hypothetical protein
MGDTFYPFVDKVAGIIAENPAFMPPGKSSDDFIAQVRLLRDLLPALAIGAELISLLSSLSIEMGAHAFETARDIYDIAKREAHRPGNALAQQIVEIGAPFFKHKGHSVART